MWKQVVGYPDYEISINGDFRKKFSKKLLKPYFNPNKPDERFRIRVWKDEQRKDIYLHRALYEAFVGPIDHDMTIDHIDGDIFNNSISNLQQLTNRENAKKGGIDRVGRKTKNGGYQSRIRMNGVEYRLGAFKTAEEADAVYYEAVDMFDSGETAEAVVGKLQVYICRTCKAHYRPSESTSSRRCSSCVK